MQYLVQEFVAHRWFTVRSFACEQDAQDFARTLGGKTRIKIIN
jgi:hypothetical protein